MQELSEQQLQSKKKVSNKKSIEDVREKYLQPILETLDKKNIKGVRLLRQGNRVMLLIDKSQLNSMNTDILNTMNMVYPNHVVCIEDVENPFDYEELYDDIPSKRNKKVRPYQIFNEYWTTDMSSYREYYKRYPFSGIELDTRKLDSVMQLGYFLEFVNTLQTQNPLEQEEIAIKRGVEVYSPETLRRYDEYIKQGCPDKQGISLWIIYNEAIQDDVSNGLELKGDPYFNREVRMYFNAEKGIARKLRMGLSPGRMKMNVDNYIASKQHKANEEHSIQGDDIFESAQIPEAPSTSGIPEL